MTGHRTPAGKSVLDELGLDAGYMVKAKLEDCLRALGHDIEIRIGARHEGAGEVRVREAA